jgi:hypothetical protein
MLKQSTGSPGAIVIVAVLLVVAATATKPMPSLSVYGPGVRLAVAPDGSLLATDAGAGIFEIRRGGFSQVARCRA